MTQTGSDAAAQSTEAAHSVPIDIAKGLLLLLAVLPAAALATRAPDRAFAIFLALGAVVVTPGFLFLAGLVWRPAPVSATLRKAPIGVAAVALAAATGIALGGGWRGGLADAAPALQLVLLPLLYGLAMRLLAHWRAGSVVALACALHVAAVILGGTAALALAPFVYFAVGVAAQPHRARLERLATAEREIGAAAAPVAVALALIVIGLAARRPGGISITDIGPACVPVGIAAGVATFASGAALAGTQAGDILRGFGRSCRAAAIFWAPLLFAGAAVADPAAIARPFNLVLLAIAALAALFLAVEAANGLMRSRIGATLRLVLPHPRFPA